MPSRIAIIGAGITGLVAGRELARRGFAVTLIERWPDVGGQASAFDVGGGVWLDRYYHHLFQSDAEMIALHDELLPGELERHSSSVGMWANGRIWPFTSPFDLLAYAPLPIVDRARLGLAVLRLQRRADWEAMDDMPAFEWLRRECGARALDAVWRPLMLAKFGDDAERIPLAWLWSKLILRRRLRGSSATSEELVYPRGSFRPIATSLAEAIKRDRGDVVLDREVLRIHTDGSEYVLECAAPGAYRMPAGSAAKAFEHRADAVLLTTPTYVTRRLAEWPDEWSRRLDDWTYRTAVVLLLELRRPFSDTYWINIADREIPFIGLIEHTNLVPAERYPARYLYVSNYVARDDPIARMSTDELFARYLPSLRRINPRWSDFDVMRRWSFREEAAQPIPRVRNRQRVLPFTSPRRGLFIANTTQIYPEDRGTNYSARLGRQVAEHVAREVPVSSGT